MNKETKTEDRVSRIPTTEPETAKIENLRLWASAVLPFAPCTATMGQDGRWHLIGAELAKKYSPINGVTCEFVTLSGLRMPFGNPLRISFSLDRQNSQPLSVEGKAPSSLFILLFPTGNLQVGIDYREYDLANPSKDRIDLSTLFLPILYLVGSIYGDLVDVLTAQRSQVGFIDAGRAMALEQLVAEMATCRTFPSCINSLAQLCASASEEIRDIAEAVVIDVFEVYPTSVLKESHDFYLSEADRLDEYFSADPRPLYVGYHSAICETEEDSYLIAFSLSIYFTAYWIYDVLRDLSLDVLNARLHQTSGQAMSSAATVYLFFGTFAAQAMPVALTMNNRRTRFFAGAFDVWGIKDLLKGAAEFANQLREEVVFNSSMADQKRGQFYSVAVAVITVLTAIATIAALERSANTLTNVILSSLIIVLIYASAYLAFRVRGRRGRTSVPITEALEQIRADRDTLGSQFRPRDLWG